MTTSPLTTSSFSRRSLLAGTAGSLLAGTALSGCSVVGQGSGGGASNASTVKFGVSAPTSGPLAEYGKYYQQGFAVALDQLNADGGVDGKPIELVWEDSQSDPKQSVPIAQKFVADSSIVAELGDFSSGASMAATPVYQQAKLVQFGFTNSNPKFTAGGDRAWSTSLTQENYQDGNTRVLAKYGKKVAVFYLQTDWGKGSFDLFQRYAGERGLEIVYSSPINPDSQDFRPVLLRAREQNPDMVAHLGYGPDGALLVKQLRDLGFTGTFLGGQATDQYISIAGRAGEGTVLAENYTPTDPAPRVKTFVKDFTAKFQHTPGAFHLYAYDALHVLVQATRAGGATRQGVFDGLSRQGATFDTVQFGALTFTGERRPASVKLKELVVKDGVFVVKAPSL